MKCWLVYRDPYTSLLESLYTWVVFDPLYNPINQGFDHCSCDFENRIELNSRKISRGTGRNSFPTPFHTEKPSFPRFNRLFQAIHAPNKTIPKNMIFLFILMGLMVHPVVLSWNTDGAPSTSKKQRDIDTTLFGAIHHHSILHKFQTLNLWSFV